jgi:hypothetical protein
MVFYVVDNALDANATMQRPGDALTASVQRA